MSFLDSIQRLLGNEMLVGTVENPQPYSPEEAARRKKRVEEMMMQQPQQKTGFLDSIKDFLMPTVSVQGKGTNFEDLSHLSDPVDEPSVPEMETVLPPKMPPKPQAQGNMWEQMGRTPSNPYSEQMQKAFGEQTPQFEGILRWGTPDDQGYMVNYGGENLDYNATGVNVNDDGSLDTGLFQINSNTFADFMKRKPERMAAYGITSYNDMKDPFKNMLMAKIIFDEQGQQAWYGSEYYRKRK